MTGYGKAMAEQDGIRLTVEIKSLNSKQLDLSTRIPSRFKPIELEVRTMLSKGIVRGKVDFGLFREQLEGDSAVKVNVGLVKDYQAQLKQAAQAIDETVDNYLPLIMKMPDVFRSERQELDEQEAKMAKSLIAQAITQLNTYRQEEGAALLKDLELRVANILKGLSEIEAEEDGRKEGVRTRLQEALNDGAKDISYDQNRFEQELIYYLEKYDVTEEKVRLRHHCSYFNEMLAKPESQGKKLGFIAQEIGREINTIGSKANHAPMQRSVVNMKDELEKIKEQLLNVL